MASSRQNQKIPTLHDPALIPERGLKLRGISRPASESAAPAPGSGVQFRSYQLPVFLDNTTGILVLHWSRQIGKSFTLAAWAVDRMLNHPGRLVTVLSNSRENGAEFLRKCAEICRLNGTKFKTKDDSPDEFFQHMRMELTIRDKGKTGRIKVLAANPRTARGFSGDLILDEFAFHEDSAAIWEAAEPILSSNPDFLCRIASTGNGKHNMFYRIANGERSISLSPNSVGEENAPEQISRIELPNHTFAPLSAPFIGRGEGRGEVRVPNHGVGRGEGRGEVRVSQPSLRHLDPSEIPHSALHTPHSLDVQRFGISQSAAGFKLSRVPRTLAHQLGVPVFDPRTRQPITPEAARAQALDKRAYDQNYECVFADENLTLLSHELISAAEADGVGEICEQDWSPSALAQLKLAVGPLYVGFDVARHGDLSVITVIEKQNELNLVRAILRIQDMRLPEQQLRLGEVCRLPKFHRAALDMTGLGLGLFEYAQKEFGAGRIHGINFATTVPATDAILAEGRARETVRVTEAMAMELLQAYEDRRIRQPIDPRLRDDLRKPEKITTPGGRVSIAATRTEAGHADHFWSLALALEAAGKSRGPFAWQPIKPSYAGLGRKGVLM